MTEIKGAPTDKELEEVDTLLMSRGWINLLDQAGLSFRERQVIGWALRMAPRFRSAQGQVQSAAKALVDECEGGVRSPSLGVLARLESALHVEWTNGREP
jgi:hypothetical protein